MAGLLAIEGVTDPADLRRGRLVAAGALAGVIYCVGSLVDGLIFDLGRVLTVLAASGVPVMITVYALARRGSVDAASWLVMGFGVAGYVALSLLFPGSARLGMGAVLVAFAGFTLRWWAALGTAVVVVVSIVVGAVFVGEPLVASIGTEPTWIAVLRQLLLMTLIVVAFVDAYDQLWVGIADTQRQSATDLEELKALHDQLENTIVERTQALESANAEMETFSYSVSHDLRAPLRHIRGYLDMYVEDCGATLADADREHLDEAIREAVALTNEVESILAAYRPGSSALK